MLKFHMNTNETEKKTSIHTIYFNQYSKQRIKNKNLTIKTRIRKNKSKYKLI